MKESIPQRRVKATRGMKMWVVMRVGGTLRHSRFVCERKGLLSEAG